MTDKVHQAQNDQISSWSFIKGQNKIVINSLKISGIKELSDENLKGLKKAFHNEYPDSSFPKDFDVYNNA